MREAALPLSTLQPPTQQRAVSSSVPPSAPAPPPPPAPPQVMEETGYDLEGCLAEEDAIELVLEGKRCVRGGLGAGLRPLGRAGFLHVRGW